MHVQNLKFLEEFEVREQTMNLKKNIIVCAFVHYLSNNTFRRDN